MKVLLADEVFDGQLLRVVAAASEGGSDYGEAHSTASRIKAHDIESWHREWKATATRIEKAARTYLERNHHRSAYEAFLRASMYHRASGQFFIGSPGEERCLQAFKNTETCFTEAMKMSVGFQCESVKIPYKDTKLPGFFLTPSGTDHAKRGGQTLIVNGGYDSTKEECFFFSGAAALRRGFNVLLFDGPGQGLALMEQKLTTIPDWETVITPVVDYLHTRSDVDKSKIAAMGISLGGYQVPRAATTEKRLAAIIADPGQIDIGERVRVRLPLPQSWKKTFPRESSWLVKSLISTILGRKAADPSYGWTLRRIQHVHGLGTLLDMFSELERFKLDPADITCPCFVSWAERDELADQSREFYDRLGSKEKKFVQYKEVDGAAEHCETGNRSMFNADCLDWLEELWA